MPRNGSGSYSLPEPPFVPLTTISSAAVNSDYSDIAAALTASLARDGQGGMTDVLPLNTAGFTYTNDLNTGMYRTGADAQAIKCGGTDIAAITTGGVAVTGDVAASGTIKQAGFALIPVGFGPAPWSGRTAPSGWLLWNGQTLLRASYPALWTFAQAEIAAGNTLYGSGDGTTTFTLADLQGVALIGNTAMTGGTPSTKITQAVYGTNPAVLGNFGGAQNRVIAQANLPNVNFNVDIPAGQGSHIHLIGSPNTTGATSGPLGGIGQIGVPSSASTLPAMTGTAASGGSGTSLTTIQPSAIVNYIVYAGV